MSLPAPYYEADGITIYHGDCREILPHIPRVDLLLMDPPYGIGAARKNFGGNGVKRHMTGLLAGKAVSKRDYGDADWDDVPPPSDLLRQICAKGIYQVVWGGNYFDLGPARCYLVWDKLRGNTDFADAELAWTNLDRTVRVIRYKWNGFLMEKPEQRVHPTQKPLEVIKWVIENCPADCATVLDAYMGSGTTLVAAKMLRRRAIGIEINEKYCEIAVRRLAQEVLAL